MSELEHRKEVLERIKEVHEQQMDRIRTGKSMMYQIHPSDVSCLIKEVERLKGLEESLRLNIKIKQDGIDFLKKENERYREAINRFFELDGNYKDIVNKAERIFAKVLDEALESDNE